MNNLNDIILVVLPPAPSNITFSVRVATGGPVSVYISWEPVQTDEATTEYFIVQVRYHCFIHCYNQSLKILHKQRIAA